MKSILRCLFTLLLCSTPITLFAAEFSQPRTSLHTGGQPSLEDLARLQGQGVRTVIDLRGAQEERGYDEATEAHRLGMNYIALPIAGKDDITPANAKALGDLLEAQQGDVLLHCASGNRVGALLAMDAAARGVPREEALEIGRKAGLKTLEPVVVEKLGGPDAAKPL
ncbi:protein tyrosine phosphatase family protein [Pseudoxanthomonas sp. SL93]|uniref:protein tyrosine phosphatase family protein n=1 Tax=Pseudoxanthomonas sp. SL93 TaxID=2995142 RepID=UPI00226EDFB9|nr:protein tyrosine phosphatase family protein [Pseudoxanthomonas sp. SL93]WAC62619.1 protein tyrosine phosphatase family protein [Pseudoxanthomonas sp. SL93]